jgi:hypothetical protein
VIISHDAVPANSMRTAGATEYLTKDGPAERLLMAIRGDAYVAAS